jgi:hypothetical protein
MSKGSMGIGNLGENFKWPVKRFRWLIEFINDGISAGEPKFVKINSRPIDDLGELSVKDISPIQKVVDFAKKNGLTGIDFINNPEKPRNEFGFNNLWLPKGSALSPFNEVVLTLLDGCGIPLEKWILKEAKLLHLDHETLDEEDCFTGTITHTDVKYQNLT